MVTKKRETYTDFDIPWKDAIEQYLEEFVAPFFPLAHADIDWSRGYEFLDKELQRITRDATLGRRYADKLVKVWRAGSMSVATPVKRSSTFFTLLIGSCSYQSL